MSAWQIGVCAICVGWLVFSGACGDEAEPAPAASATSEPTTPSEETPSSVAHEVQAGESLWRIAKAYDVPMEEIREANDLDRRAAARLQPGQRVVIPGRSETISTTPTESVAAPEQSVDPPVDANTATDAAADASTADAAVRDASAAPADRDSGVEANSAAAQIQQGRGVWHQVDSGESLWSISRLYDVSLSALTEANALSDDEARGLQSGARVFVPGVRRLRARRPQPRESGTSIRHELEEGETIWDIARLYQVSTAEIMSANRLGRNSVTALRPGQRLLVPGVSRDARGRVVQRRTARQRTALRRATRLGLGTRRTASALLNGRVQPSWQRAAGGDRLPGTLRWPITNGRFVRGYGSGEEGYHLAVDIAGDIGWNVRASAAGIVGYSGDTIRGYGNTVILIHPGGWITMYAHNSVNFVVAGERVREGAILAEVGSTGISRGPHVHYEFKFRGQNCDPAGLFRPGIRHRGGRLSRVERVSWTRAGSRPSAVRCAPRRRHPRSQWVTRE